LRGRSAAEAWLAARPKAAASIIKEYFRIPVLPLSRWCQSGARPAYVLINALPWSPSSRKLANTGSKSARCLRAERKFALLVFQPRVALSECVANPSKLRRTCNCAPSSALGRWRSYRRIGVRYSPRGCARANSCAGEWNHADANLSYFLIVGAALFGALTLVSNRIEPKPLPVTQTIGLPPPYKPAPEANAAQNALNFASENRYSNYVR
jgi:hypothetical protein